VKIDKTVLKKSIDAAKSNEISLLQINPLEKNSLQTCQKEIEKFASKKDALVILVLKK